MKHTAAMALPGVVLVTALAHPAAAYVGPGAGLGMLGALWALLLAVLAALGFLAAWPLRRLLRSRRRSHSWPR